MATLEQIEAALRKADAAGNVEDARRLAAAYREMRDAQASTPQPSQEKPALTGEFADLPVPGYAGTPEPTAAKDAVPVSLQGPAAAAQSGAMQGMTFGFNDEIQGTLMSPVEMAIDAAQGKSFDPGRSWQQAVDKVRASDQQLQQDNPAAHLAGNIAGGVGTGIGLAKGGVTLMSGASPTVGSLAGRGAAEGALYGAAHGLGTGDTLEEKGWGALTGAGTGAVLGGFTGALSGMIASKAAQGAVPTVEDLKAQAGALYDAARRSGAVAPQQATSALNQTFKGIASSEGLISPTGRVNQAYPKISGILNTIDDYAQGTMDVAQAQGVRKILTDAAKSSEPAERRIAVMMLDQFDQFLDPLAPQIAQANQLYARAMKGEAIETAIELAGSRAGQFSGSGFENALRTEFRAMERAIIKGQLKGLSQAEIDAISKVAQGGPLENAARWIGKFAPTGNLSTLMGGTAGFALGGPVGAGAVLGAGALGRGAATGMALGNARMAATMGRAGGNALSLQPGNALLPITQGLIAGEASQTPHLNALTLRSMALN